MSSDPLVPKILQRLRRADAVAARRAEHALDALLGDGGLADLTQHDLQSYLWFTVADEPDAHLVVAALACFFDLAELNRYAGIATSPQTTEILRCYDERGGDAGARAATKAMDASGIVPPDLPELAWGEVMGVSETDTYERIAATLELALAAGELRPGGRGWRLTQQRLTRTQLTMPRQDGPALLDRIRAERLDAWADIGGQARRGLASSLLADLVADPTPPRDVVDKMAPMQWLLELAAGQGGDPPGIALTVAGNLARRVVQDAAERFSWWKLERPARSESDLWQLAELRAVLQRTGMLRRSGRRLVLSARGRSLLGAASAQWRLVTATLLDDADFDGAAQEAALMLLLRSDGLVEMRDLVREVAEVVAGSGWRDTGNGAPPQEHDVRRCVRSLVVRLELWSVVEHSPARDHTTRIRLAEAGRRAGHAALRARALRARRAPDA